jgi:hypothetical protein
MNWTVPRIWEGGDVWIIGGGPSITKEFQIPSEVVNDVVIGKKPLSLYSPYMESIHKKHIIGINVAYMLGPWVDMVFFGDNNFFVRHKEALYQFPGLKLSCTPSTDKFPWVKYLSRNPTRPAGISPTPQTVSWNKNSGAAAISVAVHTGAKRIFLLGFDMRLDTANSQHFHSVYNVNGQPKNVRSLPFQRHLQGFPAIARDAKSLGIQIINVNPESAINEFPKMSLKEALRV